MTDALLFALIPALVFLAIVYYINRSKYRRRYRFAQPRDEGYAGKFLRGKKPRTTPHTLINRLLTKPVTIAASVIGLLEEFADVSFYQGVIDWAKMRTKARKVIVRAGQNLWVDTQFRRNWTEAKRVGMKRGCYWFWDDRVSPGKQAALLVSLIKDDLPELEVFADYERNYGGAFGGLRNAVAFMQEVERLLPGVRMGFYTGYFFMRENSNPILHRSQYAYLATKKLWLAFYAPLADVRIPAPWSVMTYWQKGTPSVGRAWGAGSEELDMNEDMDGDPDPTPIPPDEEPEEGATMHGTVTSFTNIRADRIRTSADLGDLLEGDRVTYETKWAGLDGLTYCLLTNATRNGVPVRRTDGKLVGEAPSYAYAVNIRDDALPPAPVPGDTVKVSIDMDVTAEFNGRQYAARVSVADVVMVETN